MDAAVMAKLQRLGTNATGGTYPEIHVPLLDLGTGGEYLLVTGVPPLPQP